MGVASILIFYRRPPPLRFCNMTSSWTVKINVAKSGFKPRLHKENSPSLRISAVVLSCERAEEALTMHEEVTRRSNSQ